LPETGLRQATQEGARQPRSRVKSPGFAKGHQVRRVPVLAGSIIRTAGQPDLYRRDPPQAGAPSRAARSDFTARGLGESPAAAPRECRAWARNLKQVDFESSGGKALRRRWSASLRSGSDQGQTALPVLRLQVP